MTFGQEVRNALKEQGKTPYWLAKTTGIPKTTIYGICYRDSHASRHEQAIREALGLTAKAVLTDEDVDRIAAKMLEKMLEKLKEEVRA